MTLQIISGTIYNPDFTSVLQNVNFSYILASMIICYHVCFNVSKVMNIGFWLMCYCHQYCAESALTDFSIIFHTFGVLNQFLHTKRFELIANNTTVNNIRHLIIVRMLASTLLTNVELF